jgi:glycerophosphoryl diester phosphodiesterase
VSVRIIGHRGARGLLPENTIAGFERALALGVDMVEIDVQVTADGVPVVVHDTVLTGALYRRGGSWLPEPGLSVRSATWAKLRALDAGTARPGGPVALAFPEQQPLATTWIPRLSEVLSRLAPSGVPILLEIKRDATDPEAPSAADCVEAMRPDIETAFKRAKVLVFQSFDWAILAEVQRRWPAANIAALTSEQGTPRSVFTQSPWLSRWANDVARHGASAVIAANGWSTWSACEKDLDPETIRRAKDAGLDVFAWTVNELARARALVAQGVDGVITDYPDRVNAQSCGGSDTGLSR